MNWEDIYLSYQQDFYRELDRIANSIDDQYGCDMRCEFKFEFSQNFWTVYKKYLNECQSKGISINEAYKISGKLKEILQAKVIQRIFPYSKGIFHRIGQGLMFSAHLYGGKLSVGVDMHMPIRHEKVTVRIQPNYNVHVYDCGSLGGDQLIDRSINDLIKYNSFYGNIPVNIEVLYISHFDADHINGIANLCRKCHVNSVMMPYLSPVDAVINAILSEPADEETCRTVMFPVEYIASAAEQSRQCIDLVCLHGDDDPFFGEAVESAPGFQNSLWNDSFVFRREETADAENRKYGVRVYHAYPRERRVVSSTELSSDDLGAYSARGESGNWDLMMLYYIPRHQEYNMLKDVLIKGLQDAFPELLKEEPLSPQWMKLLIYHLCVEEDLRKIRGIYDTISKNSNRLSMCLAISPKPEKRWLFSRLHFSGNAYNKNEQSFHVEYKMQGGTLLITGDAEMNATCEGGQRYYYDICQALQNAGFCPTEIALLPHHGSKENITWDAITMLHAKVWVVSYGKDNQFYHPHLYPASWMLNHTNVQFHNGNREDKMKGNFPGKKGTDLCNYKSESSDADANYHLIHCHDNSMLTVYMR